MLFLGEILKKTFQGVHFVKLYMLEEKINANLR